MDFADSQHYIQNLIHTSGRLNQGTEIKKLKTCQTLA